MTDEKIQALKEPGTKNLDLWSAEELAVLKFTDRLTSYPSNITEEDLEELRRHFDETQIVELILTVAVANFTNRFNDGARTPVDV